jgi:hypothetical protein
MNNFTTPIENLPELEDLEAGNSHNSNTYNKQDILPVGESEKFAKYIRGNHNVPQESGMLHMNPNPNTDKNDFQPHMNIPQRSIQTPMHYREMYEQTPIEEPVAKTYKMPLNSPSCLDVADHIANCPICSKFYNTDNTIYIIAIVILAVICILLLKRVLEN